MPKLYISHNEHLRKAEANLSIHFLLGKAAFYYTVSWQCWAFTGKMN